MLRKASISDIEEISRIHLHALRGDFLPRLGERVLRFIYINLIKDRTVSIYVVDIDEKVVGFAVGSINFNKTFKNIIVNNFIQFVFLLLPQIVKRPFILKNIFETLFYTKKEGDDLPDAELVVIAILKKYHRKGFGRKLIFALEKIFLRHRVKRYKLTVNGNNYIANSFYLSLGFIKIQDFNIYGKRLNLYVKTIK